MAYKYAYQDSQEGTARAVAKDLPISTKDAVMLAQHLRGRTVERAERILERVLAMQDAVPFTRYTDGAGHKPGMGPGKYPVKTAKAFRVLLNSVKANAIDHGLGEDLVLVGVVAQQASRQLRYGRQRGRQRKATHVEMVVREMEKKKQSAKAEATPAADATPVEAKPAADAVKSPAKDVSAAAPAKKAPVKSAPVKKTPVKKAPTAKKPAPAPKASEDTQTEVQS